MKHVLEELYYGNIRPYANRRNDTIETQELIDSVHTIRKHLYETFTDSQKAIFDKYEQAWSEIISVSEKNAFSDGFRLGMQITIEGLS